MAELTAKLIKTFSNVSATGSSGQSQIAAFGARAQGTTLCSKNTETLQNYAEYGNGIKSALINDTPLSIQELDGLCYTITRELDYLQKSGIPEYNIGTEYFIGSFAAGTTGATGNLYMSNIDNNVGNDALAETNWYLYKQKQFTSTSSTNYTIPASVSLLHLTATASANIYLPAAAAANKGKRVLVINDTVNSKTILVTGGGNIGYAASVGIGAYNKEKFICDGTRWYLLGRY